MNRKFPAVPITVFTMTFFIITAMSFFIFLPVAYAGQKLDSLLSYQVKKNAAISQPRVYTEFSAKNQDELTMLKVYIYFSGQPSPDQLEEITALGAVLYPETWFPSVYGGSAGFLLGEVPVNQLTELAAKDYVTRLTSAGQVVKPCNDLAAEKIEADFVRNSLNVDGSGVKIAVLDSGLDLDHADIKAPIVQKDYSSYPQLDDDITDMVSGHGTHVTGSAVGLGTLSTGKYKGMAPGADLIFLKVGDDYTGDASGPAIINAFKDARNLYGADIITLSYGGWSVYHDGSDEMSQAVDTAVSQGAAVFVAAANDGDAGRHYSGTVAAGSSSGFIRVDVDNSDGHDAYLGFNTVWYDGSGVNNDLELEYYDAYQNRLLDITMGVQSESPRGTESEVSSYNGLLPPGISTYYLKVVNRSPASQFFHIYEAGYGDVQFADPDPNYTIGSPAEADGAIAVGGYVTRIDWTNYKGEDGKSIQPAKDVLATWSSRGPRVDGVMKPDIVAPGSVIISCRDSNSVLLNGADDQHIVDNDGLALNGSGPADYVLMAGTSMASPIAAGAAALIMQAEPGLTSNPAQLRSVLEDSATDKGEQGPDNEYGFGLINVRVALNKDALSVVLTNPADKARDIPVDSAISATFSTEVEAGDNSAGIALLNNADNSLINSTCVFTGKTLTITHASLAGGTVYRVDIPSGAVKNSAGESLSEKYSFTFTTASASVNPPRVSSVKKSKGAIIIKGSKFVKGTEHSTVFLVNKETMEEIRADDYGQVQVKSSREINISSYAYAGGTYLVIVVNPDGGRSNDNKSVTLEDAVHPVITKISPKSRRLSDKPFKLSIYGEKFMAGCLLEYKLHTEQEYISVGEDCSISRKDDKIIVKEFPGLKTRGRYDIRVTNIINGESYSCTLENALKIY